MVTNCLTGKADYLSEKRDCKRRQRICLASCSMPYLLSVAVVDGYEFYNQGYFLAMDRVEKSRNL